MEAAIASEFADAGDPSSGGGNSKNKAAAARPKRGAAATRGAGAGGTGCAVKKSEWGQVASTETFRHWIAPSPHIARPSTADCAHRKV